MSEPYHPTADRLEAFVEGSLAAGERVVLESHLVACPACQARTEEWRALFSVLDRLPQYEPSVGFANRVMAQVRVARQGAWQQWTERANALVARAAPKTNFGWSLAVALLALPVILGGGVISWLVSRSYITPQTLLGYTRDSVVEGLQGFGSTVIGAAMQTDAATWIVANVGGFINSAGVTGVGAVLGVLGTATLLSIWVLYRNLFRSPSRESDYALFSF
ncbi:MAG TPA: zf-HC2 domain-containing protein [Longimicrobiales bacterium]